MVQTNPRQFHTQQVHYVRKTVNYNDVGISAGVRFGLEEVETSGIEPPTPGLQSR